MTSQGANDNDRIKSDALQLKIMQPQLVGIAIPENQPGVTAPVYFTLSVTNNTQVALRFRQYGTLIPEIIDPNGQALNRTAPIDRQDEFGEHDCMLIPPGDRMILSFEARLSWQNNSLQLIVPMGLDYWQIPTKFDNYWSFDTFRSGEYQIRFSYYSPAANVSCLDRHTGQVKRMEVIGTGELATPFANFRLLQPVESNKNALELDGIRFETLIPEPLLIVPNQRRNAEKSVRIGMGVTNNTLTPFYFNFYSTFVPDLVMPDGRVVQGGYNRNLLRQPEESDFLLVRPGKIVTFFPTTTLSWNKREQFFLVVHDGNGGFCPFGELKPGKYQIRFRYQNSDDAIQRTAMTRTPIASLLREKEKLWSGRVDTPFVEFRLAQP